MSTPRDLFPDLYPNAKPSTTKSLTPSISKTSAIKSESKQHPLKELWCETQWTALSLQAKNHGLAKDPYFDPKTMRLSKEVNMKLWKQLVSLYSKLGYLVGSCDPIHLTGSMNLVLILSKEKLYNHLGPDKAAFATPIMLEGGEIEWYSFVEDDRGQKGMPTHVGWRTPS
jgi:hypothetical protein